MVFESKTDGCSLTLSVDVRSKVGGPVVSAVDSVAEVTRKLHPLAQQE